MDASLIRVLQRQLGKSGLYDGAIDGVAGPKTQAAVAKALEAHPDRLPSEWRGWPEGRRQVACLQVLAHEAAIDAGRVDGRIGPQTRFAAESLAALQHTGSLPPPWRDSEPRPRPNPNRWPKEEPGSLDSFFGPHGLPGGRSAAVVSVECPWPLKLAWDRRAVTRKIGCNAKVADSLARVLHKVHGIYGEQGIRDLHLDLYGGCYNPRKKRGGSGLSTHSWAIAIDWDPEANQLKWGRDRARLARPDYEAWWDAWEEEGWLSLGRARNFDWMHVQATT